VYHHAWPKTFVEYLLYTCMLLGVEEAFKISREVVCNYNCKEEKENG
jgi:hypothetical protein